MKITNPANVCTAYAPAAAVLTSSHVRDDVRRSNAGPLTVVRTVPVAGMVQGPESALRTDARTGRTTGSHGWGPPT